MAKKPLNPVTVNRSHPLARGLVAAWLLNESPSRVLTCATGNPLNDLQMGSDANWTYTTGEPGIEHDFDTNNPLQSRIDVGADNPAALRGALELSIYARLRYDPGGGGTETIYANGDNASGAVRNGFALQTFSIDDLYFWNCYSSNNFDSGAINYFFGADGTDVSVAMSWTGAACRYWKNGQWFANTTISQQPILDGVTVPMHIGAMGGNRYWNDAIYEVFLWNRALSDADALQLYLDPYVVFDVPTVPAVLFPGVPSTTRQLSGAATASAATATGTAAITLPALQLSGAATASNATASGDALIIAPTLQLSGAAIASNATASGTVNVPVAGTETLSGSATASAATATGDAKIVLPALQLSGDATASAATATGTALIVVPPQEYELSGGATAAAATASGSLRVVMDQVLAGAAIASKALGSGTATVPAAYPDQGEVLHVQPEISDLAVQPEVSTLNVINQTPTRRR